MRRPRCGDGSYILMVSVTDAELVMLVAHVGALAALGDVAGCAGNVCRVSWCPIALLSEWKLRFYGFANSYGYTTQF